MKWLYILLAVVLFGIGIFGYTVIYKVFQYSDNQCERMYEIAKNKEKIDYIDNWMMTRLNNSVLYTMGHNGTIRLIDEPDSNTLLEIDWSYLGINKHYAFVRVNRSLEERANYMDVNNIKSITIGEGRFSVTIQAKNSSDFGLDVGNKLNTSMKQISDRVVVDCDGY